MTITELGNGVRRYFHADPDKWIFRDALIAFGEVMIDIAHVEEFVSQHQDYNGNESLRENITRIYGKDAADFVEKAI